MPKPGEKKTTREDEERQTGSQPGTASMGETSEPETESDRIAIEEKNLALKNLVNTFSKAFKAAETRVKEKKTDAPYLTKRQFQKGLGNCAFGLRLTGLELTGGGLDKQDAKKVKSAIPINQLGDFLACPILPTK